MQKTYWPYALIAGLVLLGGFHTLGFAENSGSDSKAPAEVSASGHWNHSRSGNPRGGFGFAAALNHRLDLSPEQLDAVRGLLAQQHQQTVAMREETDQKIRALLNAEQKKKFDSMLAEQKVRRSHPSEPS
jgi:hypothetical protein